MGSLIKKQNHQWRTQQQHQPVMANGVDSVVGLGIEAVVVEGVEVVAVAEEAEDVAIKMVTRAGCQLQSLAALSRMEKLSLWRRSTCSHYRSRSVTSLIHSSVQGA